MANVFIKGVGGGGVKLATLSNPASASDVFDGYEGYDDTGTLIQGTFVPSNPTLSAPTISISSSTLTITDSANNGNFTAGFKIYIDGVLTATQSASTYDLSGITSPGTYAIRVKAYGTNFIDSALSNEESYVVAQQLIYGVSGMYDSSPTLTRTDDAVGMSAVVNSSTGLVSSDFDSVFPWNEATVETISGNKFLKMPDMWFRVGADAQKRITDIAVSKTQGTTGNWYHVDSFYYGCYGGSENNGVLQSVSGVARVSGQSRASIRLYAEANGIGYFQLDLYHHTVMQFLWLIEWANKNSYNIMGSGPTGGTYRNTGGTDSLTTPSGFNTSTKQIRYHYIEDFIGNYMEYVDGVSSSYGRQTNYYATADTTIFSDTQTGYSNLGYYLIPSNYENYTLCVSALGWNGDYPFLCLPRDGVGNSSYNTYFCDGVSPDNNVVLCVGNAVYSSSVMYGLFNYTFTSTTSTQLSYKSGRLLYVPPQA